MNKTSKITSCTFKTEWQGQKGLIYFHELKLENGDSGSIGTMTKNPPELSPGKEITYTITSRMYQNKEEFSIKVVKQSSGFGGKSQPKDEARITYLSCLSSAANLFHGQGVFPISEKQINSLLEVTEKLYQSAITKTSLK